MVVNVIMILNYAMAMIYNILLPNNCELASQQNESDSSNTAAEEEILLWAFSVLSCVFSCNDSSLSLSVWDESTKNVLFCGVRFRTLLVELVLFTILLSTLWFPPPAPFPFVRVTIESCL